MMEVFNWSGYVIFTLFILGDQIGKYESSCTNINFMQTKHGGEINGGGI